MRLKGKKAIITGAAAGIGLKQRGASLRKARK